jgi:hypothetical protein
MKDSIPEFRKRVEGLPVSARRLLCLIARLGRHGPLRSKEPGVVTMPELHEACGLEVDAMSSLLTMLSGSDLIAVNGAYPFEEITFANWLPLDSIMKRCEADGITIERVVVDLRFDLVAVTE